MQQVLRSTTSASSTSSVASMPSASSSPARRSESCSFIWHPKVRIRYFPATTGQSTGASADEGRLGGGWARRRALRDVDRATAVRGRLGRTMGAVLDGEADRGAALAVDLDVGERRDAHQVDVR